MYGYLLTHLLRLFSPATVQSEIASQYPQTTSSGSEASIMFLVQSPSRSSGTQAIEDSGNATRRDSWFSQFRAIAPALLLALLFFGCDAAPGTADLNAAPPRVFDLEFSPDSLNLANLDPAQVSGDSVTVDISVGVFATDIDGDLASVSYTLLPPLLTDEPIASGTLQRTSGDQFATTARVSLPIGQTGNYVLTVYAADEQGQLSNQVRGTVELAASVGFGSAPVIEEVFVTPNPLNPPATLVVQARVSDAEGLANILGVEVNIRDVLFRMSDDGESLGDPVAGDGVFTASFTVSAGTPAGTEPIVVQAFDRNGNESDVVVTDLTIQ